MPVVIPLIAAADVLILALVGVLAYYGSWALGHLVGGFLAEAPVIGDWLASRVEGLATAAADGIRNLINASTAPVIALFSTPARMVNAFVASAVAAARTLSDNVVWVATELLPSVGRDLTSEINGTAVNIERWVSGTVAPRLDSRIDATDAVVGTVQTQLAQAYRDLAGIATEVGTKADATALAATDAVVGRVQTQVSGAYADLAGQQTQITALGAAVGAIPGYVDTQVRAGVGAAEGYANGAVAGLAATLAPTIASTEALAAEAATFVRDCGEPMCDWWHSNSDPLGQLLQLVGLAELGALVVAAVEDPGAVASAGASVISEFEALGNDVLGLLGLGGVGAGGG